MENKNLTRRTFIKGTIGAGIAMAGVPLLTACDNYDAKGLPTAILGSTGVRIPKIALGLGSRFCNIADEDVSSDMLNFALDNGLYYWDTAHIYENRKNGVISEERIGEIAKYRRKEIFLSTKVTDRDPDLAMKQIESSLKRLQTDKLDMLKIHSVESLEDIDEMSQKGHLIDIVQRLKEEGVTRFIGFSGHGSAKAMATLAARGEFDSMLIAMNHWGASYNPQNRQELAVPAALENGMGVMLMKAVRPKEKIENVNVSDLVRFALSLEGPAGVVIGMDSLEVVKSNLDLLRNFVPMSTDEKKDMAQSLSPFFNHENLEWMNAKYQDGNWA
jgi:predicted aldo/keto reductase-like oxidoreductase